MYIVVSEVLGVGRVMGSMFGPNHVIAKDVKNCTAAMSDTQHSQYEYEENRCN